MGSTLSGLKKSAARAQVYIDDDGLIYDASLNQTNISGNNNKVRISFHCVQRI